jgi:O-antigen/teichoic acid export membrane protein
LNPKGVFVVGLQFVQVGLAALSVIYLARVLDPADYGWFVYYSTIAALLPQFAGAGGEHVLMMQGSRDARLVPALFGNTLVVRTLVTLVMVAITWIYVGVVHPAHEIAILCIVFAALLTAYPNPLFLALYRIQGRHVRPWILGFVAPVSFLIYLLCIREGTATLERVAVGFLLSQLAVVALLIFDLFHLIRPKFDAELFRRFARPGGIFCASQSFDYLSARIDVLLVQFFAGPQAVGLYAAAQKIISLLQILPSSFHVVELPEFHRLAAQPAELSARFFRLRALMIELGLGFAGWLMLGAEDLIFLLFGKEYAGAEGALRVLAWFGVLLFVTYPYYMLAEAMNRIEARLVAKVAMTVTGSLAIILLVQQGGFAWAGWGIIIGQAGFIGILHGLTRQCAGGWREIVGSLWPAGWVAVATFGAGALQVILPASPEWALAVLAVYVGIYAILAWMTGTSALIPTLKEASRALRARMGLLALPEGSV